MNAMNLVKKTAAVVLSAAVAVGSLSLANIVTEGADIVINDNGTQTDNYISMPITLRDFAADGMLFESNLLSDAKGSTFSIGGTNASLVLTGAAGGTMTATSNTGYINYKSSSANPYITYYLDGTQSRNQLRYAVIAYRTSATYSAQPTISHRSASTGYYSYVNFNTSGYNKTTWTTVVLDLGSGTGLVDYVTIFPKLSSGNTMDIAFTAFFANKTDADKLANACNSDTSVSMPTPVVDLSTVTITCPNQTASSASGYTRYTSNTTQSYTPLTFYVNGKGYTRNNVRYLAIKYRASRAPTAQPTIYHRSSSGNYTAVNFPTTGYGGSTWATAVVDLGSGTGAVDYITLLTSIYSGGTFDIAYAALFSSKTDADNYILAKEGGSSKVPSITSGGKTYIMANNAGFGLLATNANSYFDDLGKTSTTTYPGIVGSSYIMNQNASSSVVPDKLAVTLNSGITQDVYGALIRTDLVQGSLGVDADGNKKLMYTEGTVEYIAKYLQKTLPEVWENANGTYNLWYVMGVKMFDDSGAYVGPGQSNATKDLAQMLREQITGGLGTYADAVAKNPKSYTEVSTYFDAAYFLLHNTFSDSIGYGKTISEYNSLRLYEKVKADGTRYYTFNSAYNDTVYDSANGVIYNSQTTTITPRVSPGGSDAWYVRGNLQSIHSFNPIGDLGYGKSGGLYYEYAQHFNATYTTDLQEYYSKVNYNLSLEGHAQFIYYEDDDLYFTFTGDDDVYLFINGKRVLDLGGGHSIARASIKLNDVADQLGLVDGKVYDFDFYYMERAGTAANFGIETNMKIVEPSMITNKLGFQNGTTTGYNGFVDPSKNVGYGFELTNSGNEPITNLTFTDATIGVALTKDAITLNSRSSMNEMYAIIYDAEGKIRTRYNMGELTADLLKNLLAEGIDAGEKFGVYGVKYDITNADWSSGGDTFTNTVKTTAESRDNVTLTGYAEWKVQKRNYSYDCFNLYDWLEPGTQQGVTVTKAELLQPIVNAGQTVDASSVNILLCSPSGNTDTTSLSPNAKLNSDGSITYTGAKAGVENIYYKVTGGSWDNVVFHYHAYTYSVTDNAYVLDYGLSVELNEAGYGFMANDKAVLDENTNTTATITGISNIIANFGSFTYGANSLKYTPNKFMSGVDSLTVTIQVKENGADSVTKFTGVTMTQTVKVMPANVVYYEDDFAGLTYLNNNGNQWVQGSGSGIQSANPNGNYGSDPYYANDQDSVHSNGSVGTLNVTTTADVLTFDFTGTGFELVSHTTYGQYAVIDVTVTKANGEFVKRMPVITESKGGHLYQVPIISITGLERDDYTVTVKAAGSTADAVRMFYVDGIRVFNPLENTIAKDYYNPGEYNAQFLEVKQLIQDGKTVYANASENSESLQFVTGTTLIEDVQSNGVLTSVGSLSDYMTFGPNNEIYLDGNAAVGMIAFYLTVDESVAADERTIQIGAHRKVDSVNGAVGSVTMVYGSTAADLRSGTNAYTLYNGTEQYYTVDISRLSQGENGRYLVMIGTNGSATPGEILSLTTLKLSGYTLSSMEAVLAEADDNGNLSEVSVMDQAAQLYGQKTGEEE